MLPFIWVACAAAVVIAALRSWRDPSAAVATLVQAERRAAPRVRNDALSALGPPCRSQRPTTPDAPTAVDLFWIPLGAGGRIVRFNGMVYEAIAAGLQHRERRDLYHTAL